MHVCVYVCVFTSVCEAEIICRIRQNNFNWPWWYLITWQLKVNFAALSQLPTAPFPLQLSLCFCSLTTSIANSFLYSDYIFIFIAMFPIFIPGSLAAHENLLPGIARRLPQAFCQFALTIPCNVSRGWQRVAFGEIHIIWWSKPYLTYTYVKLTKSKLA